MKYSDYLSNFVGAYCLLDYNKEEGESLPYITIRLLKKEEGRLYAGSVHRLKSVGEDFILIEQQLIIPKMKRIVENAVCIPLSIAVINYSGDTSEFVYEAE